MGIENATILVVEDERIVAKDLARRLQKLGCRVPAVVGSGTAAIQKAAEIQPDLILMDIHLKGDLDGIDAALAIRERFPIPIVYLTAFSDGPTVERAKKTEPLGYVLKPFEDRELQITIEMALYKHWMAQQVKESEERYRNLFENAHDGILTVSQAGTITQVNRALEVMLGWSREDLVGQPYHTLLSADAAEQKWTAFQDLTLAGLPPFFETEYVGKDGRGVPVEGRTSIIEDRDGTPIGFQAMCRDISVRKILEQQRADFLAMLTHDIRNPLSVIGSYAELLRPVVQEFGEREDILGVQRIENNARTVNALITNYLQLSKIEAGHIQFEKQPVQLNCLLRTLELQYAQDAQLRRIHLQFALQDDLPLAVADTSATDRILANLLHNALKFTPKRGCVTVRSFLDKEEIGISVTDTGPGIGSPELLTIFDKYQKAQAGQQHEGSGLGLFIVKTFTERQGGRIEVQSSVGQGSCFTVFLPVAAPRGRSES